MGMPFGRLRKHLTTTRVSYRVWGCSKLKFEVGESYLKLKATPRGGFYFFGGVNCPIAKSNQKDIYCLYHLLLPSTDQP